MAVIPSPNEPPIFSALRTALPSVTSLQLTSAPQGGTYVVVEFPEATVRTLVPGNSTVSEAVNLVAASCATALGRARRRAVESAVRAVASPAGYDLVSVDREGDSWVATATHPSSGRVSATVPAPDVRGGEAEAVGAALHAALSAEVAREAATADVRAAVTRVVSGTWVGRPRVVSGKSVGRTVTLTLSWLGAQETGSTEAQEGRADEAVAELARRLGDRVRVGAIDRAREAAARVRLLRTTVDVRADERLAVVFRAPDGTETASVTLDSESADVASALVRSAALRSAAERLRRETEVEVSVPDLRLDAEATLSGISVAISCGPVSSVLCVPPDAEPGDILVPEARRVAAARAEVEKRRRFRAAVAHASSALGLSAGKLVDEVTQKHPDAVPADLSADELRQWAVRNGVSVGGLRGVEEDTRCLVEAKGRVWPGGSWCAELSSVTGRRGVRDAVEVVARANYLAAVRAACRERGVVLGPSRVEGDTTLVETDAGVTVGVKRPETWRDADVARAVEAAVEAATLAVTRRVLLPRSPGQPRAARLRLPAEGGVDLWTDVPVNATDEAVAEAILLLAGARDRASSALRGASLAGLSRRHAEAVTRAVAASGGSARVARVDGREVTTGHPAIGGEILHRDLAAGGTPDELFAATARSLAAVREAAVSASRDVVEGTLDPSPVVLAAVEPVFRGDEDAILVTFYARPSRDARVPDAFSPDAPSSGDAPAALTVARVPLSVSKADVLSIVRAAQESAVLAAVRSTVAAVEPRARVVPAGAKTRAGELDVVVDALGGEPGARTVVPLDPRVPGAVAAAVDRLRGEVRGRFAHEVATAVCRDADFLTPSFSWDGDERGSLAVGGCPPVGFSVSEDPARVADRARRAALSTRLLDAVRWALRSAEASPVSASVPEPGVVELTHPCVGGLSTLRFIAGEEKTLAAEVTRRLAELREQARAESARVLAEARAKLPTGTWGDLRVATLGFHGVNFVVDDPRPVAGDRAELAVGTVLFSATPDGVAAVVRSVFVAAALKVMRRVADGARVEASASERAGSLGLGVASYSWCPPDGPNIEVRVVLDSGILPEACVGALRELRERRRAAWSEAVARAAGAVVSWTGETAKVVLGDRTVEFDAGSPRDAVLAAVTGADAVWPASAGVRVTTRGPGALEAAGAHVAGFGPLVRVVPDRPRRFALGGTPLDVVVDVLSDAPDEDGTSGQLVRLTTSVGMYAVRVDPGQGHLAVQLAAGRALARVVGAWCRAVAEDRPVICDADPRDPSLVEVSLVGPAGRRSERVSLYLVSAETAALRVGIAARAVYAAVRSDWETALTAAGAAVEWLSDTRGCAVTPEGERADFLVGCEPSAVLAFAARAPRVPRAPVETPAVREEAPAPVTGLAAEATEALYQAAAARMPRLAFDLLVSRVPARDRDAAREMLAGVEGEVLSRVLALALAERAPDWVDGPRLARAIRVRAGADAIGFLADVGARAAHALGALALVARTATPDPAGAADEPAPPVADPPREPARESAPLVPELVS